MSLSFSGYVRFIFHLCPVLSLPVISLHLPSCRLVSLSFVSLSFPLHPPCFHFCPFHVRFSSPVFPFHFPLLSCHVDFLFPPLISLHFLAFPFAPQYFPQTKHGFSSIFAKRTSKNTHICPDFRQKEAGSPNQQRAGRGIRAWHPCLRLVERHQINYRAARTRPPPPPDPTYQTLRGGGGVILYPLLGIRHASALSADICASVSASTRAACGRARKPMCQHVLACSAWTGALTHVPACTQITMQRVDGHVNLCARMCACNRERVDGHVNICASMYDTGSHASRGRALRRVKLVNLPQIAGHVSNSCTNYAEKQTDACVSAS